MADKTCGYGGGSTLSIILQTFGILMIVIGTIGNALIVIIRTRSKFRLSNSTVYMVALAVSDQCNVFTGLFRHFIAEATATDMYRQTAGTCLILFWLQYSVQYASSWILAAFNIERAFILTFPLNNRWSRCQTIWIIIGIAVATTVVNVHMVFTHELRFDKGLCPFCEAKEDWVFFQHMVWPWLNLLFDFILPFVVFLVTDWGIYKSLNKVSSAFLLVQTPTITCDSTSRKNRVTKVSCSLLATVTERDETTTKVTWDRRVTEEEEEEEEEAVDGLLQGGSSPPAPDFPGLAVPVTTEVETETKCATSENKTTDGENDTGLDKLHEEDILAESENISVKTDPEATKVTNALTTEWSSATSDPSTAQPSFSHWRRSIKKQTIDPQTVASAQSCGHPEIDHQVSMIQMISYVKKSSILTLLLTVNVFYVLFSVPRDIFFIISGYYEYHNMKKNRDLIEMIYRVTGIWGYAANTLNFLAFYIGSSSFRSEMRSFIRRLKNGGLKVFTSSSIRDT